MNKKFGASDGASASPSLAAWSILAGVVLAMPLVPGPGLALILLGLGILSLEFERPRIWLARIKARGLQFKDWFKRRRSRPRDES